MEEIPSAAFSTEREQAPQCGAATIEVADRGSTPLCSTSKIGITFMVVPVFDFEVYGIALLT